MVDKPRTGDTDNILRLIGVDFSKEPAASTAAPAKPSESVNDVLQSIGVDLGKTHAPTPKPAPVVPPAGTSPALAPEAEEEAQRISRSLPWVTPIAEGVPVVGALPRHITAAVAAGTQPRTGMGMPGESFGQRMTANEAVLQRASDLYAERHPVWSTVGNLMGGAAAAGPVSQTALGGILMGTRGPTVGARMAGGGAGGAGIGALDAALRGEDPGYGGIIGGAGGVLAPMVSNAARSGTRFVSESLWPPQTGLEGVMRPNINRLTAALEAETPQSIREARRMIGPQGMLADINPQTTNLAIGAANRPGPNQSVMHEAVRERTRGQRGRIETSLDTNIAPRTDIEAFKEFTTEARKAAADPLYDAWRSSQVQPTPELKALIPRLQKAGAFGMAQELADITGDRINTTFFTGGPTKEFPTTQTWDYVKRGLDRSIDKAYAANDKTLARALSNLRSDMLAEIEKTPAGAVWKQARREFADRSEILDQIERGRDTLLGGRSGMSPDELKADLRHIQGPALQARIQGLRSAVDEAMNASIHGDRALRDKLLAPNNLKKIALMVGDKRAKEIENILNNERFYAEQSKKIIGGSDTAPKTEAIRALDPPRANLWDLDIGRPTTWLPPSVRDSVRPSSMIDAYRGETNQASINQLAELLGTPNGQALGRLLRGLAREKIRRGNVEGVAAKGENILGSMIAMPGATTVRRQYPSDQDRRGR